MTHFETANLIRIFDFYLAAMFVLGLTRRFRVYWDAIRLIVVLRGRWPKLVDRLKQHHGVLVTGQVLRPLALAFALTVTQMVCSRLIWPTALLTVSDVTADWWRILIVLIAMGPMVGVDTYFLVRVGRFDRGETEQYLDKAEHWLGSWQTPVIKAITFGYVNPHRIVDEEVIKGLDQIGQTVSWAAWWVSIQVTCRVAFGLVIWLMWALSSN